MNEYKHEQKSSEGQEERQEINKDRTVGEPVVKTREDEFNERLKPFIWYVPDTDNKKLYWIWIAILAILEIFLAGSMFLKDLF